MHGEAFSVDEVCALRAIEKQQGRGLRDALQRFISELTRKSQGKPVPPGFDEEGFEITALDYSPDLATVKAECGLGWNFNITEERFRRRCFEVGQDKVQTKLHAPKRLIWSLEARNELEDVGCSGATIREGVAWALTHDVKDYPKGMLVVLLGSPWRDSVGNLWVPHLYQEDGRWCLGDDWGEGGQWNEDVQFLAVRRKFQR